MHLTATLFWLKECHFGLIYKIQQGIQEARNCVPGAIGIVANIADAIVYAVVDKDSGMAILSLLSAATFGCEGIIDCQSNMRIQKLIKNKCIYR